VRLTSIHQKTPASEAGVDFLSHHPITLRQITPRSLSSSSKATKDLAQRVFGMARHIARPQQFPSGRHARADDRIDKVPIFEEELAHLVGFEGVFNNDRNERNVCDLFAQQFENKAGKIGF
jgi:protein tyrosine phosphatase (PTP) superfamily phosphohydrolase (DUF442 family)